MFGQNVNAVFDATARSPARSGIITPTSDDGPLHETVSYGTKKRKRDGSTMDDLLTETFVVRVSLQIRV